MKSMEKKEPRFPVFRERFNTLLQGRSVTEFADFLGMSRQTIGFYLNGDRIPDALVLKDIAEKCEVSADWLLGMSEFPRRDLAEMTAEDMGLTQEAASGIFATKTLADQEERAKFYLDGLNMMLSHVDFHMLCGDVAAFAAGVEIAWEYEENTPGDGKPLTSSEHPNATVLEGYDQCEYYFSRLQHDFGRLVEKLSGYPKLRIMVSQKRQRYFEREEEEAALLTAVTLAELKEEEGESDVQQTD